MTARSNATSGGPRERVRLPWAQLFIWALTGTIVTAVLVAVTIHRTGDNPLNLIQPASSGPTHAVIQRDFPGAYFPPGIGHDGQQFYAIARDPIHITRVATTLANPRYRLQRILFPLLAWALHPSGGGYGLVWAMLLVNLLAVIGGGVAAGALAVTNGGRAWSAVLFGLTPGVFAAARITTGDNLAMAFVLVTFVLSLRGRPWLATAAGVAAVLTREVSMVPLIGLALWRRDRCGVPLIVFPAAAALSWFLVLRALLPKVVYGGARAGFLDGTRIAFHYWSSAAGRGSLLVVILALVLGAAVMALRHDSPLALPVLLELVLPLFIVADAINLFYNVSRTLLPATLMAAVALASPHATHLGRRTIPASRG